MTAASMMAIRFGMLGQLVRITHFLLFTAQINWSYNIIIRYAVYTLGQMSTRLKLMKARCMHKTVFFTFCLLGASYANNMSNDHAELFRRQNTKSNGLMSALCMYCISITGAVAVMAYNNASVVYVDCAVACCCFLTTSCLCNTTACCFQCIGGFFNCIDSRL